MGDHSRDSPDDDARLLAAIARGDEAAYAKLYERYGAILFTVLVRIVGNRSEAEDLLQDVFLQVWQRARDFDPGRGRAFSWLTLLARSRALDRLRSSGLRDRMASEIRREVPEIAADPSDRALESEMGEAVRKALESIPESQVEPLRLAYFEGLTQSEIAQRLGRPLGTVKTQTRAAILRLRSLIRR